MPLSRQEIVNYYLQRGPTHLKEAAAAAATNPHLFRGNHLSARVVVRIDLNGYSDWAQGRTISDRVDLLDDFFDDVPILVEIKEAPM